jgi:transposase-like protein
MILCCPECRSIEVYEVAGGYVGQVYRCKKCGYRGSFVLEIDEQELGEFQSDQPETDRE